MDFINWELLKQFLSEKIISRLWERGKEWLNLRKLEDEYKKTLKKVFEKPLPLDGDLVVSLKEVYTDPKGVKDLISNQSLEPKGVSHLIWDRWEDNQNSFILLLGQPGGGKSSLIKKLSYDWEENNREPYPKKVLERNLYTVQLRYLPEEFKDDPVKVLTNYLRGEYDPPHDPFLWDEEVIYLFKDYKNSILLLDGLDEFVMNYQLTEEETKNLLERFADGLSLSKYNCKVLITSRPNYLSEGHLRDLNKRWDYTVWELQPFTLEEINKFLDEYKRALTEKYDYQKKVNPKNPPKMHLENFDLLKDRVEENLNAEEPLVNQPLLLYMFAHLYLREGKTPQIGNDIDLYEELINAVIHRVWENDNHLKKVITSAEWDYLYRRFLEELAFLIEFSNKPYATLEEIEKLKVFKTLKGKTKLSEKALLGSLLTFFYLHRGSDKGTQTVEFIHKTFQEYFAASNIYNRLLENLYKENKEYEDLIWDLFSKKQIPPKVREFLETIIEKHREEDREKQDQFLEKMKEVFPSLLEKDFVVKPHELVGEKPLNKPLWCFGNLWVFASEISKHYLSELGSIPDNTKWWVYFINYKDFIRIVKYLQSHKDTSIQNFPLERINLSYANLSRSDLIDADLRSANLSYADLIGANLSKAKLENANLMYANLSRSDLIDADLRSANLSYTDLIGANLSKAKLENANLENANLEGADLRGAIFDPEEIKKAKNWDKAIYDDEMKKILGLE